METSTGTIPTPSTIHDVASCWTNGTTKQSDGFAPLPKSLVAPRALPTDDLYPGAAFDALLEMHDGLTTPPRELAL